VDPNTTLEEIRDIVCRKDDVLAGNGDAIDDLEALADLVDALDGWLSRGGFLPAAWQPTMVVPS
jgi:hypothetical protein